VRRLGDKCRRRSKSCVKGYRGEEKKEKGDEGLVINGKDLRSKGVKFSKTVSTRRGDLLTRRSRRRERREGGYRQVNLPGIAGGKKERDPLGRKNNTTSGFTGRDIVKVFRRSRVKDSVIKGVSAHLTRERKKENPLKTHNRSLFDAAVGNAKERPGPGLKK